MERVCDQNVYKNYSNHSKFLDENWIFPCIKKLQEESYH